MNQSLTSTDLAALRRADTLVFRCEPTGLAGEPFVARIDAIEERRDAHSVTTMIPLQAPQIVGYHARTESVHWLISPARYTPEVASFLHLLRVGDRLRIQATVNNSTERQTDEGWMRNELRIQVTRERKRGAPLVLTFLLDVEVTPTEPEFLLRNVKAQQVPTLAQQTRARALAASAA